MILIVSAPQIERRLKMLASAPLIVLICLLLSYLKGMSLLVLICAITLLYCVRRHTFKPAPKQKALNMNRMLLEKAAKAVTETPTVDEEDEAAKKVFWQSSEDKLSNIYQFPKSSSRQAVK
jgi:hypothetical protein